MNVCSIRILTGKTSTGTCLKKCRQTCPSQRVKVLSHHALWIRLMLVILFLVNCTRASSSMCRMHPSSGFQSTRIRWNLPVLEVTLFSGQQRKWLWLCTTNSECLVYQLMTQPMCSVTITALWRIQRFQNLCSPTSTMWSIIMPITRRWWPWYYALEKKTGWGILADLFNKILTVD